MVAEPNPTRGDGQWLECGRSGRLPRRVGPVQDGPGQCRRAGATAVRPDRNGECAGSLRVWPPPAAAGDFAVRQANFVDHTVTDQSSIIRFIEDNWLAGQRIPGSFDALANSVTNMLDFSSSNFAPKLTLDPNSGQRS